MLCYSKINQIGHGGSIGIGTSAIDGAIVIYPRRWGPLRAWAVSLAAVGLRTGWIFRSMPWTSGLHHRGRFHFGLSAFQRIRRKSMIVRPPRRTLLLWFLLLFAARDRALIRCTSLFSHDSDFVPRAPINMHRDGVPLFFASSWGATRRSMACCRRELWLPAL